MKKLFFIATLLVLASITALAQVSQTPKTITYGDNYFGPIPTVMTNGTLYMTNYVDGNIEIYDETLTKVKEFAAPSVTVLGDYDVTKEREYAVTLNEDSSSIDYVAYVTTLSEVMRHLDSGFDSVYVDAQGNTLFLPTDGGSYQDSDNKKYPNRYYLWQSSTKYLFRYQCYYKFGYTGDWVESRKEYETYADPIYMLYYYDMTSGYEFVDPFYATQTLFNTDDAFEYIQPVYSSPTESWRSEEDRDGDGEIDKIDISYRSSIEGANIVSETGKVLQSVKIGCPDNRWRRELYVTKIGKTFYLEVNNYYEVNVTFYAIVPTTSSIKKVGSPIKTRIHPTMAERSQQITVETEASNMPRTIVVSNAAGQTVWKQTIAAGQTSVQVDASRLSPGVNIVNVSGGKDGATSCKVIVN